MIPVERRGMPWWRVGVAAGAFLGSVVGWTAEATGADAPPGPWRALVAAVHVHSTASTGTLTVEQIAELAEERGLDAVLLSDNFVLRYEYGVLPLRRVLRHTVSLPSVLDYGVERYLADVAAAQTRHPRVLLIPGIEVTPHYYWTGSLWNRNLTMHDSQKNLLVFGLSRAEELMSLPVNGNHGSDRYGWETMLDVSPGVLFIPAVWLWRRRSYRTVQVGVVPYRTMKRYHRPALILAGMASVLVVNAWPFSQPVFSQYEATLAYAPHQTLIDAASARGGVAVWSMPEARDFSEHSYGPLGTVTIKTDPYPDALLLTTGHAGFGGLYEDTRTATQPGGVWDQVIGQYLTGQRQTPSFAFGEIAFHGPGEDQKALEQVLTVLWVRERTAASVLDAIRSGRLYSTYAYRKEYGLRLDAFQLEDDLRTRTAESGETFIRRGARDVAVQLAVSATDGRAYPVTVTIVRSGKVIARVAGETPLQQRFVDHTLPPGERAFYRVVVVGQGEVLSSPIFVKPGPPA